MSRTLDSTMATALQAQGQEIFWLVQLEFSSGTLRLTTAQHNIVWGGTAGAVLGTDNFLEAVNTNMDSHTPDSGVTAWEYNTNGGASDVIVDAAVDYARFVHNDGNYVRSTNDLVPTSWMYYSQGRCIRNSVDGTSEQVGLYGYADSSVAAASIVGEGFTLTVVRGASASVGNVVFREINSSGTAVQNTVVATGVDWNTSGDIYLRYEVRDLEVKCFYKESSGDEWTLASTETLTLDVRDSDHRRVGFYGNDGSQASSSEPFLDEWEMGSLDQSWVAVGGHLTLDAVEESPDRQTGVNLTLDGVDTSVIALVLGANYLGRQATVYYGLMGTDGEIVVDPVQFGPYYMLSQWTTRETRAANGQATATVRTRLTSRLAPLSKIKGIVTNVRSHEKHYSGDVFFEFIPKLVGKRIIWGGQSSGLGGGGVGGGGTGDDPKDEGDIEF